MSRLRRHNKISGQFSPRLTEMLESPAYRVLSVSAHQVLSRIEVELAHHGGNDNGNLPLTYENFISYGQMDRKAVSRAISELEALGFIEVTESGCGGNSIYRRPNKFRLTYHHCAEKGKHDGDGTHEWRLIKTIEEAEAIAKEARATPRKSSSPVGKKPRHRCAKSTLIVPSAGVQKAPYCASGKQHPTSISGEVYPPDTPFRSNGRMTLGEFVRASHTRNRAAVEAAA